MQATARVWPRAGFAVVAALPFGFLVAFTLFPLLEQWVGSFFSWYALRPDTFVGVANYTRLFADSVAALAAVHTVCYVLITVPCEVGLGLAAAALTLRARRGQAALVALFILPLVVPWPTAADLASALPASWLDETLPSWAIIIVLGIWKGTPWCYLLLLGALSTSPREIFEAARIDGARGIAFVCRIMLPVIRPMFVFVVVLRILAEAQAVYAVSDITGGGPHFSTQVSAYYAYELAFSLFQFGTGSALGSLVGAALLVVVIGGWLLAWPRRAPAHWPPEALAARRREWPDRAGRWVRETAGPRPRRPRAGGGRRAAPGRWRLAHSTAWANRARRAMLAVLAVLALAPFAGAWRQWTGVMVRWQPIGSGLRSSAIVTAGTLAGTLLLAIPAAYLLARTKFRLNGALFLFILLTLATPGVITLLPQVVEISWLHLGNTRLGLVLLYIAANLPLAVFFLRPAFASVPQPLVDGMRADGAGDLVIIRRLFLPFTARTIIAVAVLVVVYVWSEVPLAVALLNSNSLLTMPVLASLNQFGSGSIGAAWITMAPPLLLFLLALPYFRRGLITSSLL